MSRRLTWRRQLASLGAASVGAVRAGSASGLVISAALAMLAAAATPACGSEVQSGQTGGGGQAAAAGGTADGGSAGGGGCNATIPCQAFPDWDDQCEGFEGAPHHFVCGRMGMIAADCVYTISNCTNCGDWCCPPEPWNGPTYADLSSGAGGAGGDAPAPAGCERQPDDDFACDAQDKPPYAVYCPGFDTDNRPDGDCVGPDCCIGNPYGANSCAGPDEGYFCCPAP